jgi:hypothetical protein
LPEARRSTQATAAPAADAQRDGRGWVADLLRRASRDEDGEVDGDSANGLRTSQATIEGLGVLTADIARGIDEEALGDVWVRYNRGERNVFTRRLYTLQGQATFEEIRRKYNRGGEFRGAVDLYIDDFEQLLIDVARSDRDGSEGQAYLASESGKVYTMLAHAAGRLD